MITADEANNIIAVKFLEQKTLYLTLANAEYAKQMEAALARKDEIITAIESFLTKEMMEKFGETYFQNHDANSYVSFGFSFPITSYPEGEIIRDFLISHGYNVGIYENMVFFSSSKDWLDNGSGRQERELIQRMLGSTRTFILSSKDKK